MPQVQVPIPTHVGIALFRAEGSPTQLAIVLSTNQMFDKDVYCGTVIQTVNGWFQSWKKFDQPPAFEPYLELMGIIAVATVQNAYLTPVQIYQSISGMEWTSREPNDPGLTKICDGYMHAQSNDYVRRALTHLWTKGIINPPLNVKDKDLGGHILECLIKLQRLPSRFNSYHLIRLVE